MRVHVFVIVIICGLCKCVEVNVILDQGILLGKIEDTFLKQKSYYAFKGIPFAEPPIGSLRFQPPIPHKGWNGTYEALDDKQTCFQYNSRMRNDEVFGMSGTEDCLYVSVFTPGMNASLPVIVFDYNDNFRTSFNGTKTYAPDFFIEEDVIIVTIQHRLDIFGYLTTEDDAIPPNSGLKDFILGLKWVQNNINRFGGDRNRVTILGNRGGAIITNILLYTKEASELFTGVIMQSGTAMESTLFASKTREVAFKLGDILNVKTNSSKTLLNELQNIDAEILATKEGEAVDYDIIDKYQLNIFPYTPIIEKDQSNVILKSLPEHSKIVNDVPIMIGMNSREGLDLASHYIFEPRLLTNLNPDFLFLFPIRTNYRFNKNSTIYKKAIKEIQKFYFKEGYFYDGNILEYAVYLADILQNYALNYAVKQIATQTKSSMFYYVFDFRGQLNENSEYITRKARFSMGNWGATIGDELCYLHLCTRLKKKYEELINLPSEQQEIKVLKKMVRMWSNFAKTRNPTPLEEDKFLKNFKWQPLRKDSNETNYLHISKTLRMKSNPLGERAVFWDEFLRKYSDKSVDGEVQSDLPHDEL